MEMNEHESSVGEHRRTFSFGSWSVTADAANDDVRRALRAYKVEKKRLEHSIMRL